MLTRLGGLRHITIQNFLETSLSKVEIVMFSIFQMATAAMFSFWNCEILSANGVQRVKAHQHAYCREEVESHQGAKFHTNRPVGCKDTKIFLFLPLDAMLSVVYAVVVCLCVCDGTE